MSSLKRIQLLILWMLVFYIPHAHATITILEPSSDDLAELEFSLAPTVPLPALPVVSFLSKNPATDTLTFQIQATNLAADAKDFFQIIANPGDVDEAFVDFSIDGGTLRSFEEIIADSRTFIVSFTFTNTMLDTTVATRTRHTFEFGFHSGDQANDATDKKNVSVFFDRAAPTTAPSSETVSTGDKKFIVTLPATPSSDVKFLVLAYAISGVATPLVVADILAPVANNAGAVCFTFLDIGESGASDLTFSFGDGFQINNEPLPSVTGIPCPFTIVNDTTTYVAAVAFADTAGNLIMSATTFTGLIPRTLLGIFNNNDLSCISASVSPGSHTGPPWFLLLFAMSLFMLLAFRFRLFTKHLKPTCLVMIMAGTLLLSLNAHAQGPRPAPTEGDIIFTTTEQPSRVPGFGFLELMYGYFPLPNLAVVGAPGVNYADVYKPGAINISSGPSAILLGLQWQFLRLMFFEMGAFFRGGLGIESGRPFFVVGGVVTPSTSEEITLLMVPLQAGLGVTFHFIDRLLSLNARGGAQWTLYSESLVGETAKWLGNFSYLLEGNLKINLNWIEPFSAQGLFFSWGILNTYLSFHVFYLGRLTGTRLVFDSSTLISQNVFNALGWFAGFSFEF